MDIVSFLITLALLTLTSCANLNLAPYEKEDFWPETQPTEQSQTMSPVRPGDIVLGMNQFDVSSVWGEPRRIQDAGSTGSKHQRWIYLNESTTHWDTKQARIIYFENGRVSGWETRPLYE